MSFTKFPKVLHYGASLLDDEVIVPEGDYLVTEKLDGANAGIIRTDKGLVLHSRNTELAFLSFYAGIPDRIENGFRGFVDYVKARMYDAPFSTMENGDHIFGEWACPHTLKYPQEMYGHFYAFDYDSYSEDSTIRYAPLIAYATYEELSLERVEASLEAYAKERAERGHPVEGFVLTPLAQPDAPYQQRFKLVRPEFKEEAGKRWAAKKALQSAPVEERLATYYPLRAYEKVLERIEDHEGKLHKRHTPKVLGMTWHDYATEFLPKALRKERFPTVDTFRLKREVENRVRDLFHTKLDTGHLPAWAERGMDAA